MAAPQPHFDDHVNGGDAGLYDLLLNPRDRAFTVPQLHALLRRRRTARRLLGGADPLRPLAMLPDPRLRARLDSMDPTERGRAG